MKSAAFRKLKRLSAHLLSIIPDTMSALAGPFGIGQCDDIFVIAFIFTTLLLICTRS